MPTIIDLTPVSSHTASEPTPEPPASRFQVAMARLRFRLRVMAIVLVVAGVVAGIVAIGLLVLLALLGTAAALMLVAIVRRAFGGGPGRRRDLHPTRRP